MRSVESVVYSDIYDGVLLFGTLIQRDDLALAQAICTTSHVAISSIKSDMFPNFYKYEALCEEGVLAMLTKELSNGEFEEFFEGIDDGYLSAESNFGEEEASELSQWMRDKHILCVLGTEVQKDELSPWFNLVKKLTKVDFLQVGKEPFSVDNGFELPVIPEELNSLDGTITFTCRAQNADECSLLVGSRQFCVAAKVKSGDEVLVKNSLGEFRRVFMVDESLTGTTALLPFEVIPSGARFERSNILQDGA